VATWSMPRASARMAAQATMTMAMRNSGRLMGRWSVTARDATAVWSGLIWR
jgi:hypothetical protein